MPEHSHLLLRPEPADTTTLTAQQLTVGFSHRPKPTDRKALTVAACCPLSAKHRRLFLDAHMRLDAIEHETRGNVGEGTFSPQRHGDAELLFSR